MRVIAGRLYVLVLQISLSPINALIEVSTEVHYSSKLVNPFPCLSGCSEGRVVRHGLNRGYVPRFRGRL
jgi:hypothetical protein